MKIYTDDPLVAYTTTTISAERTMQEISMILRQYDVADIHWHYRPEANDIYIQFGIEEVIDGISVKVAAKVVCPIIWDKAKTSGYTKTRHEEIPNINVSMRAMYWYIKSHLENAYAMQSSRVAAFLPDMMTPNGTRFFDEMKHNLDQFKAVEYKPESPREVQVIRKNITAEANYHE